MNLDRWFPRLILVNVIVALAAFGVSSDSPSLMLVVEVLAGVGWWFTEVRSQRNGWAGLPRWLVSIILTLMLGVALIRAWMNSELVIAFSEFLASILVLKLWEKREIRDYAQLLTLSLFMSVAATLSQTTILVGAVWVAQIPLLVSGVMLFQIYAAAERAKPAESLPATAPHPQPHLKTLPFLRTCFGVIVAGSAIAMLIFVFIPRGFGNEQWGLGARKGRITGFTEDVEPGAGTLVSQSEAQVLEVSFRDAQRNVIGADGETMYLRGAVLEDYSNYASGSWKVRNAGSDILSLGAGQSCSIISGDPGAEAIEQQVTLMAGPAGPTPIFALYRPATLRFEVESGDHRLEVFHDTGHITTKTTGSPTTYTVVSIPDAPTTNPGPRRMVFFPSDPIGDLSAKILKQSGIDPNPATRQRADDERAAAAFEEYLRSNYTYSTNVVTPPILGNSTEWFLINNSSKSGHCEYFASALAGMCRSVGVDARVIAGYLVDEFDPSRGLFIVRASHAHAWVEVDTGENGWKTFDATPAQVRRLEERDSLKIWFRRVFQTIDTFWASSVVSFDQTQQEKLLSRFGKVQVTDTALELQKRVRRWISKFKSHVSPWAIAGWSTGVVVIIGGAWLLVMRLRRYRRTRRMDGWAMHSSERRVYRALLSYLSKRGHPKPTWLPPLAHLNEVAATDPALAAQAKSIAELIYSARFGGGGPAAIAQARDQLARIHAR